MANTVERLAAATQSPPVSSRIRGEVPLPLSKVARLAEAAHEPEIAAAAELLSERLAEGRFYVACVGQVKRGKSTLLNALVGRPILPTGVVPVTAVVTVLRYGEQLGARVRLAESEWRLIDPADLVAYVSEERNPENAKGVQGVEVFVPSALLASGMCLVDTPGIGSVFGGNTSATRAFVPHIDAAVVVIGADPPVSGEELALVQEVAEHVGDLIFVLSKADRFSAAEREQASQFARRVIEQRIGRPVTRVYQVSGSEALAGGQSWDWQALRQQFDQLATHSGQQLLRAAEVRGIRLLTERLLHRVDEQRQALVRPIEETEQRVDALRRCVEAAEQSLRDLSYLFAGEADRFSDRFEERRSAFLDTTVPRVCAELDAAIAQLQVRRGPALRRRATLLAKEIAQRTLDAWLREEQPRAEADYRAIAGRFIGLANEFLARLESFGEPGLADLPQDIEAEQGFRTQQRYYPRLDESVIMLDPAALRERLGDLVRSRARMVRRAQRAAGNFLVDLLKRNSVLIHNDFDERLLESRRRLEADIRNRLHDALQSAVRALGQARARRAAGAEAVRAELDRLDRLRAQVQRLGGRADMR